MVDDSELQEIRAAILKEARVKEYENHNVLKLDDNPTITMHERGAYVQAWLWVEDIEVDLPMKFYDDEEDVWTWPDECANPDK